MEPHPPSSLVAYDHPKLANATRSTDTSKINDLVVKSTKGLPMQKISIKQKQILSAMLPPRQWEEENGEWQQEVQSTPATRDDVIRLQKEVELRLNDNQARKSGICPIREELHSQLFDELIRQVALINQERGLMLLRCRDEIRMTIELYQTLYNSSVDFGLRKTLQAEQGLHDIEDKVKRLISERDALKEKTIQLTARQREIHEEYQALRAKRAARNSYEKRFLKEEKDNLDKFFQSTHSTQAGTVESLSTTPNESKATDSK